ncbi:hypothetical protein GALL_518170 [mine drainage metagenome]|uniref:Uncharacterized protein n=1 Tax=mine drainage metagenome TaxID=410659 RepID=A0A1J5PGD2_9ZZZZ
MRLLRGEFSEGLAHDRDFVGVFRRLQAAAHELEAAIQQVGIHHVGFAIAADGVGLPCAPGVIDLAPVHPQLARKAAELGQHVQRRIGARLIQREQVHEIQMSCVIARNVVVPLHLAFIFAHIPVSWRRHSMHQAAVMQHGKVESAAVPRHELRHMLFDHTEKALHHLPLLTAVIDEGVDFQPVLVAEGAGDDQHPLAMHRQKVAAGLLGAALLRLQHGGVVVETGIGETRNAQGLRIGQGFNVEGDDGSVNHGRA